MQRERGHKSSCFCGEWPSYERGKTKRKKEPQRRKLLEPKARYGGSDQVAER